MKKTVILGNGASLKHFDFQKIDRSKYNVIGCCLAFRHWDKIGWYPDIYVNADDVVIKNDDVVEFIKKKKCKQYIVSNKLKEVWPVNLWPKDGSIICIQDIMCVPNSVFKYVRNWCSGSACLITAMDISMDISLLGMDCDYIEFIPECKKLEDGSLEITETPITNPNYYFDDYQRKGDKYNIPNGQTIHKTSWKESRLILDFVTAMFPEHKPRITNYNELDRRESISEYFLTRDIDKFQFSPQEQSD